MAVEASKRSTRIPGIANSPSQPFADRCQFMDNDWPQFMAARQLCGAKSDPSYANQPILSCGGGMGHPAGDEFRQLSLSGHALLSASPRSRIGGTGTLWKSGLANL
jgi:hypothetical protein